ncbi:MAG: AraC family transcriptional regulator [Pseudomonadota bacterium]
MQQGNASPASEWIIDEQACGGVARLRAGLWRSGYSRHSHDRYTVSVTEWGIQEFAYRGSTHRSRPGQVCVLHPDEPHDGRPGGADGFGYRSIYLDPVLVHEAGRSVQPRRGALPFVATPVVSSRSFAREVDDAFAGPLEPLMCDAIIVSIASRLRALAQPEQRAPDRGRLDLASLARAAQHLREHCGRIVHSSELEGITGLSRFELAAQFRRRYGTSPYRFLLMRRLELARTLLARGDAAGDVAARTGFADQSHMTRKFKAAYGLTPHRFYELCMRAPVSPAARPD